MLFSVEIVITGFEHELSQSSADGHQQSLGLPAVLLNRLTPRVEFLLRFHLGTTTRDKENMGSIAPARNIRIGVDVGGS